LLGLAVEEFFDRAAGEGLGGLGSDILHGSEIDIESRAIGSEGPLGNDFSELLGESADGGQIVGSQLASCHVQTFTGVGENTVVALRNGLYRRAVVLAKWLLDPVLPRAR
jgi:hypothetical protein